MVKAFSFSLGPSEFSPLYFCLVVFMVLLVLRTCVGTTPYTLECQQGKFLIKLLRKTSGVQNCQFAEVWIQI